MTRLVLIVCLVILGAVLCKDSDEELCSNLQMGQYRCDEPEIDQITQQASGCTKEKNAETWTVRVDCYPARGVKCGRSGKEYDGNTLGFQRNVPCKWTNKKSFETALLLSIFLGMFGLDRFYLGYPALGLLKFCTLGFMFVGQLVDVILIAMQIVKPADGSEYVIDYYGARLIKVAYDNETAMF